MRTARRAGLRQGTSLSATQKTSRLAHTLLQGTHTQTHTHTNTHTHLYELEHAALDAAHVLDAARPRRVRPAAGHLGGDHVGVRGVHLEQRVGDLRGRRWKLGGRRRTPTRARRPAPTRHLPALSLFPSSRDARRPARPPAPPPPGGSPAASGAGRARPGWCTPTRWWPARG